MGVFPSFGRRTFSHGIHPSQNKAQTASIPIRRLSFPPRLIVHLDQSIGLPATALVKKGQEVVRGEPIAQAADFVSVPLHAPATGIIKGIELMPTARGTRTPAIIIDVHNGSAQEVLYSMPHHLALMNRDALMHMIQRTGLVGLGGAAFPTHVKFTAPPSPGHEIDTLIVNGAECEPYLTADHRVMLEQPKDIIRGVFYAMRATQAKQAIIGVESNKPDAIRAIKHYLKKNQQIRVQAVEPKYPQGAEKMLIMALLGRSVPPGELPRSVGVVVSNVGTIAQLGYLLPRGEGMIERVMTVAGPGVKRPGNYRIPIGTPLRFILQEVGHEGDIAEVILGGPMMGMAASSLDAPVTKGVSGILVLDEPAINKETSRIWPCIKCARCVDVCPMYLNPSILGQLAGRRLYDVMAEKHNLDNCFECGCCSYVCPSNIPLVQYFRIAKAVNSEKVA
ncbi:MAG: electron transport complex subunit RsxC [Gammaproteobacteria bacterium]|nr:electron transport complex subunit RsxC [Gammaproteobacteria bacterium]